MLSRLFLLASAFAIATMAVNPVMAADSEPDEVIKYRKNVMKAVGGNTSALVALVKGDVDLKDSIPAIAKALAASSDANMVIAAFRQNTDGQGNEKTTATAEIWSNWERFEKASREMERVSLEISDAAAAGNLTSMDQLRPLFAQCNECHKDAGFRD